MNDDIEKWILDFLSVPHPVFGNLPPCPYAKRAWLDGKVEVREVTGGHVYVDLQVAVMGLLHNFPKDKDLVMFLLDPNSIPCEKLTNIAITNSNKEFALLDDHPEQVEKVEDVVLNNGKYAILFVQRRNELLKAREDLKNTGYYDNFNEDYREDVLSR